MNPKDLERFRFRGLHPRLFLGTASDRYAGWIGQIYTPGRYDDRLTRRSHAVGGQTFTERVLPVESVAEYFTHFPVLEIDATFYSPLLDAQLKPTPTFRLLETYARHLTAKDGLILKTPQVVFARIVRRRGGFEANPAYLDAELFVRRFYEPAVSLLGERVTGFIFEQEYQAREGRDKDDDLAARLAAFFEALPRDPRFHVELRTEALLKEPYFKMLQNHGLGQVLSHWTWLPSLVRQFEMSGRGSSSAAGACLIRLVTPRRMAYEASYRQAFPFDRQVEGMTDPRMIEDAVLIAREAIGQDRDVMILVNNRAGGNAPLIARALAERFLAEAEPAGGGEKAGARPSG